MSDESKNLQETVSEVISKQVTANKDNQTTETKEDMSQKTQEGETQTGGTPEYVSGIDISDIPEQDRPKFKEKLSQKAKFLEDGYQKKYQEVAKFKKAQEDLVSMGLTVDEAQDVLTKHLEQKRNPQPITEQKKEGVKILDKLMEQAPNDQRQSFEQLRQAILEETNINDLKKEISTLKSIVSELQGETTLSKKVKAEQFIDTLSSKYTKELVEKYRDDMLNAHLKYRIPLERILQSIVPLDELEQIILLKGKQPLTPEKKNAISGKPSGVTATEKIDIKSKNLKSVITEMLSKK